MPAAGRPPGGCVGAAGSGSSSPSASAPPCGTGTSLTAPDRPTPAPPPSRRTSAAADALPSCAASASASEPGCAGLGARQRGGGRVRVARQTHAQLGRQHVAGHAAAAGGGRDRIVDRRRPGRQQAGVAVPAAVGERRVADPRAGVRRREHGAVAHVDADVVRRAAGGADEHEVARLQRGSRDRPAHPPQVGGGGPSRQRGTGCREGVVDQAAAVEAALGTALAAPDVGPSDLGSGRRHHGRAAGQAVQVDRPERAASARPP